MEQTEYYNQIVLKLCSLAAYDNSLFNQVKDDWFHLSPKATFYHKFISLCVERHGEYNDESFFDVRERHFLDLQTHVQTIHGNRHVLIYNVLYDELDKELAILERDRRSTNDTSIHKSISHYRDILKSSYDKHKFKTSLAIAKNIVDSGESIDKATLQIYYPDNSDELPLTFESQAKQIIYHNNPPALYTGIPTIDDAGGFEKANLCVIGGDTGSQKTRSSVWLCLQMLQANPGSTCIYFEREMPKRDIFHIVCGYLFETDVVSIHKAPSDYLMARIESLDEETKSLLDRFIMLDDKDFRTSDDVLYYVKKFKPDFWVIDFLTMMISGNQAKGGASDINMAVYNIVDDFESISTHTNTFGILLSQLKKGTIETRSYKVPTMDDFEWSGRLKQLASYAFSIFNPSYYDSEAPEDYFYMREAKNRYARRSWIYLKQYPERCTYMLPDEMSENVMKAWIRDYSKAKK